MLKLVKLKLHKMRSTVVWLLLLFVLVAVPSKTVDSDSYCKEDIESLEVTLLDTLETKFEQLKAEIKENCCQGNTTGISFFLIFFSVFFCFCFCFVLFCFVFFTLLQFNLLYFFSWAGQSYSSCKEIYKTHK